MAEYQHTGQPDWGWWSRLWPTPGWTLRTLGLEAGDSVAEVGCGSGYFALPTARIADSEFVYALDPEEDLLARLDCLAEQQRIANLVTIHGDARNLPAVLPETVDTLLVANMFHGVEDQAGFVRDAFETLEPGGRLLVVNWHDQPPETTTVAGEPRGPPAKLRMTPEETREAVCSASEFSFDQSVELPPYHYELVFER